jgi:hypothetical protein
MINLNSFFNYYMQYVFFFCERPYSFRTKEVYEHFLRRPKWTRFSTNNIITKHFNT